MHVQLKIHILGECFMGLLAMDILGNVLMHVGGTYDELC